VSRCPAAWPVALVLLAWPAPPAGAADEIVIGMSAAFRGPSRGLGIELYRGARAWFDEVNRQGGVHGRKIRLVARDDGYDPAPAVANTLKLVNDDGAFLLFGYVGTPTTTRVLPLLERYKDESIYLFCPFTGAEPLRKGPYAGRVFNLRASYREETGGLVKHFVAIGRKRIAVFYQIDAYGRSGWDGVRIALGEKGLKMVGEATYRRGTRFAQSLKPQVEILRATSPDAIICVGSYAACAAFARDVRDAGWDVPIANVSFVGSENLLVLLERHGKQTSRDYTANLINSQVVPSYQRTKLPAVTLYRALMDKHRPEPPAELVEGTYQLVRYSFTSLEGFLDARLVVEVLRKLGKDPRRDQLRAAAEGLGELDLGLEQRVALGPARHQAMNEVYYTVVEKGEFVPLPDADWKRWRK
jgi:ABC-type branched-subunit amino acid transport system substrate-binding protein